MFHLHRPDARSEETAPVGRGDAVLVPVRHGFGMENTGATDLIRLCCVLPGRERRRQPWPSDEREEGANREARACDGVGGVLAA